MSEMLTNCFKRTIINNELVKMVHIQVTYSIKSYQNDKIMQHQDKTNRKQLWQQQRILLRKWKEKKKRFTFNNSRHRQYNESFQTCSKL